jgi:hypothetical protein
VFLQNLALFDTGLLLQYIFSRCILGLFEGAEKGTGKRNPWHSADSLGFCSPSSPVAGTTLFLGNTGLDQPAYVTYALSRNYSVHCRGSDTPDGGTTAAALISTSFRAAGTRSRPGSDCSPAGSTSSRRPGSRRCPCCRKTCHSTVPKKAGWAAKRPNGRPHTEY